MMFFKNKWQIIRFFQILCVNLHYFILDFACALPGMPAPQIKSRVIMAPEHAKRLLQALQSNIYNYEQSFGKIKLSDEQERTIAPFGTPKGEA